MNDTRDNPTNIPETSSRGVGASDFVACANCLGACDPDDAWCAHCGAPQPTAESALVRIDRRLYELDVARLSLRQQRGRILEWQRVATTTPATSVDGPSPSRLRSITVTAPQVPVAAPVEVSSANVPLILLWIGAALLGLSAVAFVSLEWRALGANGRFGLLVVAMTFTALLANGLGRRLRATADALAVLAVVLVGVAGSLVHQTSWGSAASALTLTTVTSVVAGAFAVALSRRSLRVTRIVAAVCVEVATISGALLVLSWGHATSVVSVGTTLVLAGFSAVSVMAGLRLRDREPWREASVACLCVAALANVVAAVLAAVIARGTVSPVQCVVSGLTIGALSLAPLLAGTVLPRNQGPSTEQELVVASMMVTAGLGALYLAVLVAVRPNVPTHALGAVASALSLMAIVASCRLVGRLRQSGRIVALVGAGCAALGALSPIIEALRAPWLLVRSAWSTPAGTSLLVVLQRAPWQSSSVRWTSSLDIFLVAQLVLLLVGALVLARDARARVEQWWWPVGAITLGTLVVMVAPVALHAPVWALSATCTVAAVGGALVVREQRRDVVGRAVTVAVIALAVQAVAASSFQPAATALSLAAVVGWSLLWARRWRDGDDAILAFCVLSVAAFALSAVIAAAAGASLAGVGLVVTSAGGVGLVVSRDHRVGRGARALETLSLAAIASGVGMCLVDASGVPLALALSVASGAFLLAQWRQGRSWYWSLALVVAVGAAVAWTMATGGSTGTVSVVLAALALRGLTLSRDSRLGERAASVERVSVVTFIAAVLVAISTRHVATVATVLTVGTVAFAGAQWRTGRFGYRDAVTGLCVAATMTWIAATGVHLVEAYTWPAAVELLSLSWWQRREDPARVVSSWTLLGPALLVAVGPTTVLAMMSRGDLRFVVAALVALVVVVAGTFTRRQAPVVIGGVSLVGLALVPVVSFLSGPGRWIAVAVCGVTLLCLGATAERRRRDVQRLHVWFRSLA